jgi:hypothetical protein
MRKVLLSLFGIMALTVGAKAIPVSNLSGVAKPGSAVHSVKIICEEDGRCFQPPTRKPVAHWVYGDNNFLGPYNGPRYYGSPPYRSRWWPFYWLP